MGCKCAYRKRGDDTLRCKAMQYPNDCCAHVKFCPMTGHWENSEYAENCPLIQNYEKNLKERYSDGKQV